VPYSWRTIAGSCLNLTGMKKFYGRRPWQLSRPWTWKGKTVNLNTFFVCRRTVREHIQDKIGSLHKRLGTLNNTIIREMQNFKNRYPEKSSEVDAAIESLDEFDEMLAHFPVVQKSVKILQEKSKAPLGLQDISTPLAEFACLDLPVKKVFITENKINGLSFPPVPDSMVIFGLGYGIQALKDVAWLASKEIFYWGDIDIHGFAILSMVRHYFPDTRSFLMDRATLFDFKTLWVKEDKDKRSVATLSHLTRDEQVLYRELVENIHGHRVRLEQERISHAHVKRCLARLC